MTLPALVIDILSWAMIVAGSFFVIIGAVGILRFPDFWSRLHAASVTESAGMILLLIGMALQTGWTLIAFKLGVIGIFMLITGPTSTHAVANAALVSGLQPPKLPQTSPQKAGAEAVDKKQTGDA